jgi:uncharacterized protein (TIGR02145 family)
MRNYSLTLSLLLMAICAINAQTIMNIHQNNGTVLQIPVNTIDSITYTGAGGGGIVSNPGPGVSFNGYNYSTIILGNGQEWMAENLRTTTYANGDQIPNVTDPTQWSNLTTGAWCHYNNDSQYENPYGKLYNWYAVSDSRNVCPTGWHVPTDADWSILINYLDPSATGNLGNNNSAGAPMKSIGTQYWLSPNWGANNSIGFSGLPGGFRDYQGPFYNISRNGYWWSSTDISAGVGWLRILSYDTYNAIKSNYPKNFGLSIRCIKN